MKLFIFRKTWNIFKKKRYSCCYPYNCLHVHVYTTFSQVIDFVFILLPWVEVECTHKRRLAMMNCTEIFFLIGKNTVTWIKDGEKTNQFLGSVVSEVLGKVNWYFFVMELHPIVWSSLHQGLQTLTKIVKGWGHHILVLQCENIPKNIPRVV